VHARQTGGAGVQRLRRLAVRFLYGRILDWKVLPCKSAESAHRSTPSSEARGPPSAALVDDLVSDYRVRRVKSRASVLSHLKPLRNHFGDWRALEITFRAVEGYITKRRADEKSNATINRELELVRRALRLANDRQLLPSVPKVRVLPEHNTRQGFFERPDLEAVVAALPAYLQDVTRFAYLTGWRKGEIISLRVVGRGPGRRRNPATP
jgi:hypothetical protein